jgi:HEAT repeat protein
MYIGHNESQNRQKADDMVSDPKKRATYYIEQLAGPNRESAYHALIEADDMIVPYLIERYHTEQNEETRAALVEIIWQHRLPETIGFLVTVLDDKNPAMWKNALDGLVAIGGQPAIDAILLAQQRLQSDRQRLEWLNEALEQIKA